MDLLTIIGVVVNLLNTLANLYWSNKLKSLQTNRELLSEKEALLKGVREEKNMYKTNYLHLLSEYKRLGGKLEVYEKTVVEPRKSA